MGSGRWCFRPRPLPHELLSSWLHRLALANATRDHTLCKTMWPDAEIWARDLDRHLPPGLLPVLSGWTGVPLASLEHLQLTRWVGRLAETLPPRGPASWILPVGVYHRVRRRPGLLYCPACLRESAADAVWMWRMAWTVCCRRHRMDLLDACPACSAPYMPHRSAPSLLGRMPCGGCGLDLARLSQPPSPVWAWQFQQRMETALVEGRTQIEGQGYFALPFFSGLRSLAAVLLTRGGRDIARRVAGRAEIKHDGSRAADFELQPFGTRRWIMQACWILLQDWPVTFLEIARKEGHRRHLADRLGRSWVFWVQAGLERLEGCRQREVLSSEAEAIARWLQKQGTPVTWTTILNAAGVSTPTRIPQPAVRDVLARHDARQLAATARDVMDTC